MDPDLSSDDSSQESIQFFPRTNSQLSIISHLSHQHKGPSQRRSSLKAGSLHTTQFIVSPSSLKSYDETRRSTPSLVVNRSDKDKSQFSNSNLSEDESTPLVSEVSSPQHSNQSQSFFSEIYPKVETHFRNRNSETDTTGKHKSDDSWDDPETTV